MQAFGKILKFSRHVATVDRDHGDMARCIKLSDSLEWQRSVLVASSSVSVNSRLEIECRFADSNYCLVSPRQTQRLAFQQPAPCLSLGSPLKLVMSQGPLAPSVARELADRVLNLCSILIINGFWLNQEQVMFSTAASSLLQAVGLC